MIVLDTNIVSELLKAEAEERVVRWLDELDTLDLYVTSVVAAELRRGVALLPPGRRRDVLHGRVEDVLTDDFGGRVLAFDVESSLHVAALAAGRQAAGRPMDLADACIAAVCLQHGARLATRNGRDFEGTGVAVVDPWG